MHDCDPKDFITKEEHKDHCDGRMKWAETVVEAGKQDRADLWREIHELDHDMLELRSLVPRFQWWFIGLLIAIIITSYVMPRLARNGDSKSLETIKTQVSIVMDKQAAIDSLIYDIREDQKRRTAKEK